MYGRELLLVIYNLQSVDCAFVCVVCYMMSIHLSRFQPIRSGLLDAVHVEREG